MGQGWLRKVEVVNAAGMDMALWQTCDGAVAAAPPKFASAVPSSTEGHDRLAARVRRGAWRGGTTRGSE